MFMMKKGTVAVALIVVAGLLLLDIQLTQGLKCWACHLPLKDCAKEKPTELQCTENQGPSTAPPNSLKHDRCYKEELKDGKIGKGCISPYYASPLEKDYKCDEFGGEKNSKVCFCTGDLCNHAPLVTGYSKRQLILISVASVSAYFIVHLLL